MLVRITFYRQNFPSLHSVYVAGIHYKIQQVPACCVNQRRVTGTNYEKILYKNPKTYLVCLLVSLFGRTEKVWGITLLATALVINLSQRPPVDTQHSRRFCLISSGVK